MLSGKPGYCLGGEQLLDVWSGPGFISSTPRTQMREHRDVSHDGVGLVPAVLTATLPLVCSATHLIVRETEAQRAAPSGSKSLALTYALWLL